MSSITNTLFEKELTLSQKLIDLELHAFKTIGQNSSDLERLDYARQHDQIFAERDALLSQIVFSNADSHSYVEMRKGNMIVWSKLYQAMVALGDKVALVSLFSSDKRLFLFAVRAGIEKPEFHLIDGAQWEELNECLSNFNDEVLQFNIGAKRTH